MHGDRGGLLDRAATDILHNLARFVLRFQSPIEARQTVLRLGRRLPPFGGIAEARAAARRLARKGSCLSRSLAIAARLRESRVVIGVDVRRSALLEAHAWVELKDEIIDGTPEVMRGERLASF